MKQVEYRLWCNNKKEWEKDEWHLTPNGIIIDSNRQIEMKPESHFLSQFIGLSDKNGVKIFEGDVVKGTAYEAEIYTGEVAYLDSEASFVMKIIGSKGHFRLNNQTFQALEVVGHKFENAE